ncbi:subtilisin-like protein [Dothidotthia symphoricarpi CBS 119687]|uniref:Subtilisin-like protein n=1 Tax=Dothidotthia symphoricarpi CBS 119687 TaxID=1392245 RepID=A0A6A6AQH0_9PLEO|nr:subtilisin-like protein [Dothidotthia symphoricarpi CBS 119687]KAF2132751.1 subtilisin-like protein [Dothidotthia symphoricarpi CBS 119687]
MRTTFAFASLLAVSSTVLAFGPYNNTGSIGHHGNSTGPIGQNATCDDIIEREYIVMLNKTDNDDGHTVAMLKAMAKTDKDEDILWIHENKHIAVMGINTTECTVDIWNAREEVAFVEEKLMVQSFVSQKTGTPWGLQDISNAAGASGSPESQDFTYTFEDQSLGAGVDIYVVDTGVRTSHAVFTGRATQGFSATGASTDGDGHGTHCAGSAGGAKFGVAQGANIIAVKVLGDDGSGSSSDTISGMDWVMTNHEKRKTEPGFVGSIMSMSWGLQGTARSVNEVIQAASKAGIHVSVAAGNDGADACGSTPAQLGGSNSNVVTVGSIDINNKVSSFSNIGTCVDIYAPGEQILSAWNTGDNVINFLSGTSMACPHTTGVMAYLMAEDVAGLGQNPAALKAKLLATARQDKITGSTGGSANLLLSNGVDGGVAKRLVKNYVVPDHKRTTGSPAARAANSVKVEKKWELHSLTSLLRF